MTINEKLSEKNVSLFLWAKNKGFNEREMETVSRLGSGRFKGVKRGRAREIRRMLEADFPYLKEEKGEEWKTA